MKRGSAAAAWGVAGGDGAYRGRRRTPRCFLGVTEQAVTARDAWSGGVRVQRLAESFGSAPRRETRPSASNGRVYVGVGKIWESWRASHRRTADRLSPASPPSTAHGQARPPGTCQANTCIVAAARGGFQAGISLRGGWRHAAVKQHHLQLMPVSDPLLGGMGGSSRAEG